MTDQSSQPATLLPTPSTPEALAVLQPLTEDQRLAARERARRLIVRKIGAQPRRDQFNSAGPRPERAQYAETTISEYPAWVTRAIGAMLILAFAGAFATSAFSVFSAGRDHYLEAMRGGAGIEWQAVIVGLAVVLLSEFLTIASVLSARILLTGRRVWQVLMLLPIAGGVVMAVTANAVVARPEGFWPWLVTVAPPVSVVFLSLILEQIALTDIKRRHANERAYQVALREWQARVRQDEAAFAEAMHAWEQQVNHPEESPVWRQTYATALREMLREVNDRGRGRAERAELMGRLTGADWAALVLREMQADRWFEAVPAAEDSPANFTQAGTAPQSSLVPGSTLPLATAPAPNGTRPAPNETRTTFRPALASNGNGTR
ncbi:MAG: hypothetical protein Kow0077_29180 [Anaerolineae bacterium]